MISFEIGELIATFRDAVLSLIPAAERAHLSWRDEDTHDDWERLVDMAFRVFVESPIFLDPANRRAAPLARYDFDLPTYDSLSWIEVESSEGRGGLALVRFEAGEGDFRAMWLAETRSSRHSVAGGERRLWSPDVKFRFARRDRRSGVSLHDVVTPAE